MVKNVLFFKYILVLGCFISLHLLNANLVLMFAKGYSIMLNNLKLNNLFFFTNIYG
jgi:hypothetical protein